MDLEVARADRHLHAVAVAARRRERLRDGRLRRRRRSAARAARGGCARASSRRSGSVSSTAGQSSCSSRGGPGSVTATQPVDLEHERGRRAGEPGDDRALGHRRLLAHAGGEVRVRPLHPLGDRARARLDPRLERLVDDERPPGGEREQLDGAVVVCRPEAARDDEQVVPRARRGAPPRARRGTSPTIRSSAGSIPSASSERARNGPLRSVRSPRTSSEPVTTIARARAAQPTCTPLGVTVRTTGLSAARADLLAARRRSRGSRAS